MADLETGCNLTPMALLQLLMLGSPALPVGAYSYSEGIETLIEQGQIHSIETLQHWLEQELQWGSLVVEGAILVRAYEAVQQRDYAKLKYWNQWWSAARETAELRQQSWQMGRSLSRLLPALDSSMLDWLEPCGSPCNWAIAFGGAAAHWQIDLQSVLLAYVHSWASNLVSAGVKLVPLGQTAGQQLLFHLSPQITVAAMQAIALEDADLSSCSWGLALASSQHETLMVRLFQS
ncbi:MAG: urease accessory protein UreF [Cyanothece sp. SIO1E1]|nr:urease accessory protein UreF [Cyanothece sp. SIO1E1]